MASRMYILVKDTITTGFATVSAAHASLCAYLQYSDLPEFCEWLENSFRKVVCRVTEEEFEQAKKEDLQYVIVSESNQDLGEVAIAFVPTDKPSRFLRSLRLYE